MLNQQLQYFGEHSKIELFHRRNTGAARAWPVHLFTLSCREFSSPLDANTDARHQIVDIW